MAPSSDKSIVDAASYIRHAHNIIDATAAAVHTRYQWAQAGSKPIAELDADGRLVESYRREPFPSYLEPLFPHQFLALVQGCQEVGPDGIIGPTKDGRGIVLDDKKVDEGLRLARGIIETLEGKRTDTGFEKFKELYQQAQHAFQGGDGAKASDHRKAYMAEVSALEHIKSDNLLERIGLDDSATPAHVEANLAVFVERLNQSDRSEYFNEALERLEEVRRGLYDDTQTSPSPEKIAEESRRLAEEYQVTSNAREAEATDKQGRLEFLENVVAKFAALEGREKPFKSLELLFLHPNADASDVNEAWTKLNNALNDIPDEDNRARFKSVLSEIQQAYEGINTQDKLDSYYNSEVRRGIALLETVEENSGEHDPKNPGHHYRRLGVSDEDIQEGRLPRAEEIKARATMMMDYLGSAEIHRSSGIVVDNFNDAKRLVSESLDFLTGTVNQTDKDAYDAMLAKHYGFVRAEPSPEEKSVAAAKGRDSDCEKKSKGFLRSIMERFNEIPAIKKYVAYFYNTDQGNMVRGITRTALFGLPGLAIITGATIAFVGAATALTPIGWPFLGLALGWYTGVGFMQSAGDSFVKVYMSLLKIRKRDFDDRLQNLVERPIDSELFLFEFRDVINQFMCRVHWPKGVEERLMTDLRRFRSLVDAGVYGNLGEAETIAQKVINTLIENPVYSTYDIREQVLGIDKDLELSIRQVEDEVATLEALMDSKGSLTPDQASHLERARGHLLTLRKQTGNVKKNLSMRLVAAIELELKASKLFKLDVGGENLGIMDVEQKKKVLQGDLNELVQRWGPQKAQNFEGLEETLDSVGGQLAHLEYFFPFGLLARGGLKLREIPMGNPLMVQAK